MHLLELIYRTPGHSQRSDWKDVASGCQTFARTTGSLSISASKPKARDHPQLLFLPILCVKKGLRDNSGPRFILFSFQLFNNVLMDITCFRCKNCCSSAANCSETVVGRFCVEITTFFIKNWIVALLSLTFKKLLFGSCAPPSVAVASLVFVNVISSTIYALHTTRLTRNLATDEKIYKTLSVILSAANQFTRHSKTASLPKTAQTLFRLQNTSIWKPWSFWCFYILISMQ